MEAEIVKGENIMPYIHLKTAASMDAEMKERIKVSFGQAISLMTGKTEDVLMVCIEDGADLWLGGKKLDKGCFLAVEYLGAASTADLDALNAELFRILQEKLGADPAGVYITYKQQADWGARGHCFHLPG